MLHLDYESLGNERRLRTTGIRSCTPSMRSIQSASTSPGDICVRASCGGITTELLELRQVIRRSLELLL